MDVRKIVKKILIVLLYLLHYSEGSNSTSTSSSSIDDGTTKFLISFIMIILMITGSVLISFGCNKCLAKGKDYKDDVSDISEYTKRIIRQRLKIIKWKRKEQEKTRGFFSRWSRKAKDHNQRPNSHLKKTRDHAINIEEVESINNSRGSLTFMHGHSNKVSDVDGSKSPVTANAKTDKSKASSLAVRETSFQDGLAVREKSFQNGLALKEKSFPDNSAVIRSSSNLTRNVGLTKSTSTSITVAAAKSNSTGSKQDKASENMIKKEKLPIPSISITTEENSKRKTVTFKDQLEYDLSASEDNTENDSENTNSVKASNMKKK